MKAYQLSIIFATIFHNFTSDANDARRSRLLRMSVSTTTPFPFSWAVKKGHDCVTQRSELKIGDLRTRYGGRKPYDKWPVAKCQAKCARNTQCKGFNYNNDLGECRYKKALSQARAVKRSTHDCWVYNRGSTVTSRTQATRPPPGTTVRGESSGTSANFGTWSAAVTRATKNWNQRKGVNCMNPLGSGSLLHIGEGLNDKGKHYRVFYDKWPVAKCQAKCASNTQCEGFNYDNMRGICRYKKSLSHSRAVRKPAYDCWVYNRGSQATRPPPGTTVTGESKPWKQMGDYTTPKLYCEHLNTKPNDYPRYTIYSTLKACQDACINAVPKCNSVNYAPATVSNKRIDKGECEFQYCDPNYELRFFGSKYFNSYMYYGPTFKPTTTPKPKGECTGKCLGETCDIIAGKFQKSCEQLEKEFQGCDCSGCRCPKPKSATCDGSKIGKSAQHTSERDAHASTGYEAPGQPVGTRLSFPCRQGYESGLVTYTCGGDGKFRTSDKCTRIATTPAPWGVWHAYEPSGCPTACGSETGSGLVGDVRCSTDRCDLRTKPKPKRCEVVKCLQPCQIKRLISLAGSGVGCTMAMLGIGNPCDCLCNFALAKIQPLESCTMGTSNVDIHDQWRVCAAKRRGCGQGSDVVVVHGRRLRTA